MNSPGSADPSSFHQVLRIREFRALWLSDIQSLLGDQLARVGLSVLVFAQTASAVATAGIYALTFLPAIFGTPLGALADRLPRRALLVGGDLIRSLLLCAMAVPGLPIGVLAALLFTAVLVGSPWKAAESALVVDILHGEGYVLGSGIRMATNQAAQLIGFGVGGAVVAATGAHLALLFDAATFAISACILRLALADRPAPRASPDRSTGWRTGITIVIRDSRLRVLLGYAWLAGAFVVPEGLAVPYAAHLGGGARSVGLLLAAAPAGALLGSLLFVRVLGEAARSRAVPSMAIATGLPLVDCAANPGLAITTLMWAISGALMTYQIQIMTSFVRTVPPQFRGQTIAFASSGMLAVQGFGLLAGGALSQLTSPGAVIAWAGAAGVVAASVLSACSLRSPLLTSATQIADRLPSDRHN